MPLIKSTRISRYLIILFKGKYQVPYFFKQEFAPSTEYGCITQIAEIIIKLREKLNFAQYNVAGFRFRDILCFRKMYLKRLSEKQYSYSILAAALRLKIWQAF